MIVGADKLSEVFDMFDDILDDKKDDKKMWVFYVKSVSKDSNGMPLVNISIDSVSSKLDNGYVLEDGRFINKEQVINEITPTNKESINDVNNAAIFVENLKT